jgi:fatty acid desaturase
LVGADLVSWIWLSRWTGTASVGTSRFWSGSMALGLLHGWLLYNITSVSLHEGAAHNRLILRRTGKKASRLFSRLLNNLCRLGFADPHFYVTRHPSHHARLGSPDDGAFTHLVRPARVARAFLPFAGILPFNDYRIHRGGPYTTSRALSDLSGSLWILAGIFVTGPQTSWLWSSMVFLIFAPWWAFSFDRLRETTDHALMATDRTDAARSLGLGIWGWLLAPGPWGQCAHLVHHLFPALPWYQQVAMHRRIFRDLSPEQRQHYVLAPVTGYPRLWLRVMLESRRRIAQARHEA